MTVQTTWGSILLTIESDVLTRCSLPYLKAIPPKPFKANVSNVWKNESNFFQLLESNFVAAQIENLKGTVFQKLVWNELKKIPRGQTRTYGEIARAIGRPKAVRAVGSACGANPVPLFIPCHRVVAKTGLGGFGAGLPWKILLLKTEGAL